MVKLNKIYTRTGDNGTTGLTDGSRVLKHSSRPEAYGTVDELNSSLGLVYFYLNDKDHNNEYSEIKNLIKEIQNDLFDLGADLSTPSSKTKPKYPPLRIKENQVTKLEKYIEEAVKATLMTDILQTVDWLYDDGDDAESEEY
jgi:cob(I)alamin adenosyltransferase